MAGRRAELGEKKSAVSAFYVPPANLTENSVVFPAAEIHHLRDVLRLGSGARVEVLDGCGGSYAVELLEREGGGFEGRIVSAEKTGPPQPRLSAAVALCRSERMRITVEKLSELGCHRLAPLITARVSFPGSPAGQAAKLRRVAVSALKQSRSRFLTGVENPLRFERFLEQADSEGALPVFCSRIPGGREAQVESGVLERLRGAKEIFLVVGPESGFSADELETIGRGGWPRLHLGESILRAETAAVAGFVILRRLLHGDFYLY